MLCRCYVCKIFGGPATGWPERIGASDGIGRRGQFDFTPHGAMFCWPDIMGGHNATAPLLPSAALFCAPALPRVGPRGPEKDCHDHVVTCMVMATRIGMSIGPRPAGVSLCRVVTRLPAPLSSHVASSPGVSWICRGGHGGYRGLGMEGIPNR